MSWQPNAPDTLGPAWFPASSGAYQIDASTRAYAWRFVADDTFDVDFVNVPARLERVLQTGNYIVELFESGDEVVDDDVTTTVVRPTADLENQGPSWTKSGGGTSNLYADIDEATLSPSDYITYDGRVTQKRRYAATFGGLAAWATGRRVLAMRLHFVADCQKNSMLLRPYLYDGSSGDRFNIGSGVTVGTERAEYSVQLGEVSPVTNLPWTTADVQLLGSADGFGVRPFNGRVCEHRVYQMWVEVDWVPDTRLDAYGQNGPYVDGNSLWNQLARVDLHAGAAPQTVPGDEYVMLLRRITSSELDVDAGAVGFTTLDSGEPLGNGWETFALNVDGDGCLRVELDGNETTAAVPVLFETSGPVYSTDGMAYQYLPSVPVRSTSTVRQTFTTDYGGGDYKLLRFLVSLDTAVAVGPNADLTVGVYDVATNTLQGSLERFTFAELDALDVAGTGDSGKAARLVERRLAASATLAGGTQYYIEWASDADGEAGYFLPFGTTDPTGVDPSADAGEATFGGLVDTIDLVAFGGPVDTADAFFALSTVPDTPVAEPLQLLELDVDWAGPDGGCGVSTIDYVRMQWEPSTLGDDFARYEVQRNDDALGWVDVAWITTEAVSEWRDVEARVGVIAQYRMRVVRLLDGVASAWTPTDYVIRQGVVDGASTGWLFVSNEAVENACGYDHDPTTRFDFDRDGVTLVDLYGRDGAVRFVELEQRLDTFGLELLVHVAATPTSDAPTDGPGRRVFDALLRICGQSSTGYPDTQLRLSYTCVLDPQGNRWLANVGVDVAEEVEPFYQHRATVAVDELTKVPSIVDVELTGAMVLRTRAAWWADTKEYDGGASLPDRVGSNDLELVDSDDGTATPARLVHTELQYLFLPGLPEMWVDTPAVPALLTGDELELRWSAVLGHSLSGYGTTDPNVFLHQGSDQNNDVAWAIAWAENTGELTWYWSEDGTTVQSVVAQTLVDPNVESAKNRAVRFDLTDGSVRVYEQPFASTSSLFRSSLDGDSWSLVDTVAGAGATSLFASAADVRMSATTDDSTGDTVDGVVAVAFGDFVRVSLANEADGVPLLDADFSIVEVDRLDWVTVTGYPALGSVSSDEEATFFDRVEQPWTVHNFLNAGMSCVFVDRPTVAVGSGSTLRAGPDDAVFERSGTDDLTFVVGYRWTKGDVQGQWIGGHKRGDTFGVGDGYGALQSFLGGGVSGMVGDGAALVFDVATAATDGRVVSSGLTIDGVAATLESYTDGVGSGSPASIAALGAQTLADTPLSLGGLLDALGDVLNMGAYEFFVGAVIRGTLSDDEWTAVHDYVLDADAGPDEYTTSRYGS